MSEDLWGEFYSFENGDDISKLLIRQAEILSSKSNELIIGSLKQYIDEDDDMIYEFRIRSRHLEYTKLLLTIYHPITLKYPAKLSSFVLDDDIECADFEMITSVIHLVLSKEEVTTLLKNLLTYSMSR